MKKIFAILLILVMTVCLCACTEGLPGLEGSTSDGGKTPGNSQPSQSQQKDPSQSQAARPTEPAQPVVCDHNFSNGVCRKCGALKPTEGLEYTLNEDGQSYTLTRGWIETSSR